MSETKQLPAPGSQVRLLKNVVISGTSRQLEQDAVLEVVRCPNRSMKSFCWVRDPEKEHQSIRLLPDEWVEE